jgi:hypothetical protein
MMETAAELEFDQCNSLMTSLASVGFQRTPDAATWRISPEPLHLTSHEVEWFRRLGQHLYKFVKGCGDLYLSSASGEQHSWVSKYLDMGKPPQLIKYQRMRRFRDAYPTIIRPDVIPTPTGMAITELDSVPGGMGITARLCELYRSFGSGYADYGEPLQQTFAKMMLTATRRTQINLAIVVSEESESYRAEMTWLGNALAEYGIHAFTVRPEEVWYSEDGAFISTETGRHHLHAVYRFFELFDLPNIPKIDLLMFLNKTRRLLVTPPFKPVFEEKMWFGLFHHPLLCSYWKQSLGDETFHFLNQCFPATWILDPADIPAHATIPNLQINGSAVNSWTQLRGLGRSQRQFVIKPSGFSNLAWGSRGVIVGHDVSQTRWGEAIDTALNSFEQTPYVLQEFRTGRHFEARYYDVAIGCMRTMPSRVRLCPYYFVIGDEVRLSSILATMCALDKKKIHGMPEAILLPCVMG